jgi:hypothetical protein
MGRWPDEIVRVDGASRAEVWVYIDRPNEGQVGVFGFVGNEMRECKILEEPHNVNNRRDYIHFFDCYSHLREVETRANNETFPIGHTY